MSENDVIDTGAADLIANAIITGELQELSAEELDELSALQYAEDPDVEWDELGLSLDAGMEGHGSNTDEEMLVGAED